MKKTFIIFDENRVEICDDPSELILSELAAQTARAVALTRSENRIKAIKRVGIPDYNEITFDFPEDNFTVFYSGGVVCIKDALQIWYSANVSIPEYWAKTNDSEGRLGNAELIVKSCECFLDGINSLLDEEVDLLDFGILQVRRVTENG